MQKRHLTKLKHHCMIRIHSTNEAQKETTSIHIIKTSREGFPGGPVVENLLAKARDTGPIPGPGRSHMPGNN